MRNLRKHTLAACALVAVLMVAGGKANADPLVLSLNPPSQAGVAGGSVIFLASAFNSGAANTNTVTTESMTVVAPEGWDVSVAPFFVNWGNQQVVSGATRGPLELFSVIISVGTPDGSYSGFVNLLYLSGGAFISNSVQWTVRLGPDPVPEPTTIVLLSMGLAGLAAKVRKRRKAV